MAKSSVAFVPAILRLKVLTFASTLKVFVRFSLPFKVRFKTSVDACEPLMFIPAFEVAALMFTVSAFVELEASISICTSFMVVSDVKPLVKSIVLAEIFAALIVLSAPFPTIFRV